MRTKEIVAGLAIALTLAFFISPFASSFPDGLERVAIKTGFIKRAEMFKPLFRSPMADYTCPVVSNKKISTAVAGIVGTISVFAIAVFLAELLKRKE